MEEILLDVLSFYYILVAFFLTIKLEEAACNETATALLSILFLNSRHM